MTDPAPEVSVVVPTFNEERSIGACLDSIESQTFTDLEILVVDGGSDDGTRDVVAAHAATDPRIRLVDNPGRTQPAAMNVAAREVSGRWLVRVDAHSTVPPRYVDGVVAHLRDGDWGGVGGRKDGVAHTSQGRAIAAALGSPFGVGNSMYHHATRQMVVDHIPFGAYPVDVVDEVGGWDEGIVANEDYEFDYRVRATGRELLLDPSLVIFWETRQSIRDFFRQYRRYGRGKALVIRKHPTSASPRHLIPAGLVAVLVAALALSPRRPAWSIAAVVPYAAAVGVATATLAPQVPSAEDRRWLPAAFVAMHVGYGIGWWEALFGGRRPGR